MTEEVQKKVPEEANTVDENIIIKLTEWEQDVLIKVMMGCKFPGTHVDLAAKLIAKIKG